MVQLQMTILVYSIYAVICIGAFVYFQLDHYTAIENLTKTEYVIVTLLLSLVVPVVIVIVAVGYPFYWLHRLFHPEEVNSTKSDDDEPQGFDYEEHEEWTDGNTEYEDN